MDCRGFIQAGHFLRGRIDISCWRKGKLKEPTYHAYIPQEWSVLYNLEWDGAITCRKFRTGVIIMLLPHFMVKLVPGLPANNCKLSCRQDLPLSLHHNSACGGWWNNVTRHLSLKISSKSQTARTDLSQYPTSVAFVPSTTNVMPIFRTVVSRFTMNRKLP